MARIGSIGVYGPNTRRMQRRISAEAFGLSFKVANVYLYLGSRASENPDINDIQNTTFFETPDAAYSADPIQINIGMDPMGEAPMDFSSFGIINPIGDQETFRVHMNEFKCLGRPLIIGDVFEIPFFQREEDDCKKAYWKVDDVDDKPSYEEFYYVIKASVLNDDRKTREISVDRSNGSLMDDVMDASDERFSEVVPSTEFDQTEPEDVDYRDSNQKSFLDDPSKVFNED